MAAIVTPMMRQMMRWYDEQDSKWWAKADAREEAGEAQRKAREAANKAHFDALDRRLAQNRAKEETINNHKRALAAVAKAGRLRRRRTLRLSRPLDMGGPRDVWLEFYPPPDPRFDNMAPVRPEAGD